MHTSTQTENMSYHPVQWLARENHDLVTSRGRAKLVSICRYQGSPEATIKAEVGLFAIKIKEQKHVNINMTSHFDFDQG